MPEPVLSTQQRQQFNALVWAIAREIPSGAVASYGQLAAFLPTPTGIDPGEYAAYRARWAGAAMRECPPDVPWQRVLNAQGKISLPAGSRAALDQRRLLEAEGVVFDERERIDLARFGWSGPPRQWLLDHGLLAPDEDFQQGALF
jgi:methylated-DNA-protein-cysteine methyltransferase-like protein